MPHASRGKHPHLLPRVAVSLGCFGYIAVSMESCRTPPNGSEPVTTKWGGVFPLA